MFQPWTASSNPCFIDTPYASLHTQNSAFFHIYKVVRNTFFRWPLSKYTSQVVSDGKKSGPRRTKKMARYGDRIAFFGNLASFQENSLVTKIQVQMAFSERQYYCSANTFLSCIFVPLMNYQHFKSALSCKTQKGQF